MSEELVVDAETGEVLEQPDAAIEKANEKAEAYGDFDVPEGGDEAGEEEAEADAEREREAELAAERQQQEQEQAASVEAQKAVFDKADRKAKAYAQGMAEILGDLAGELGYCPRCADFYPGFILPHAIKPVTEEQRVAVKVSMGETPEPILKQTHEAMACDACDGYGKVATGSRVRNQTTAKCPRCEGRGWVGSLQVSAPTLPTPELEVEVGLNGEPEEAKPATDPWGRMPADPNYGVLPGFES